MFIPLWLSLFCLLSQLAFGLDLHAALRNATIFISSGDLHVPLNPAIWANMNDGRKLIVGIQSKSLFDLAGKDQAKSGSSAFNFKIFLMDGPRGLVLYQEDEVAKLNEEKLTRQTKLESFEVIGKALNLGGRLNMNSDIKFLPDKLLTGHLEALPLDFWYAQDRTRLAEIVQMVGLVPLINIFAYVPFEIHKFREWTMSTFFSAPLDRGATQFLPAYQKGERLLLIAMGSQRPFRPKIKLGQGRPKTMRNYGEDLLSSYGGDWITFLSELDENGVKAMSSYFNHKGSNEELIERILRDSPPFNGLPKSVKEKIICKATTNTSLSVEERLLAVLIKFLERKDASSNDVAYVSAWFKDVFVKEKRTDLDIIAFLRKIPRALNVNGVSWNPSSWPGGTCRIIGTLPKEPEYLELFLTCLLFGHLPPHVLPPNPIGGGSKFDWEQMKDILSEDQSKEETLTRKLDMRYWRSNTSLALRPLLYLLEVRPESVVLPLELLKTILNEQGRSGLAVALLAHGYRRNSTVVGKLLEEQARYLGLRPAYIDGEWNDLKVPKLKAYLAREPYDLVSVMLFPPSQIFSSEVVTKSLFPTYDTVLPPPALNCLLGLDAEVIQMVCAQIALGNFDPEDLGLLAILMEAHGSKISTELLLRMLAQIVFLDATSTDPSRAPSSPTLMRKLAWMIHETVTSSGDAEIALLEAEATVDFNRVSADFTRLLGVDNIFNIPTEDAINEHKDYPLMTPAEAIDVLVWQTPGIYLPSLGPVIIIMSYIYPKVFFADEVVAAVKWATDQMSLPQVLTMIHHIQIRSDLLRVLFYRLHELGFMTKAEVEDLFAFGGEGGLRKDPLRVALSGIKDEMRIQQILLSLYEVSPVEKTLAEYGNGSYYHPRIPRQSIPNYYYQQRHQIHELGHLSRTDGAGLKPSTIEDELLEHLSSFTPASLLHKAISLAYNIVTSPSSGTTQRPSKSLVLSMAFKLVSLAQIFNSIPLSLIIELLKATDGAIGTTTSLIRTFVKEYDLSASQQAPNPPNTSAK